MKKTFRKHGVLYTWDSEAWDEDNQSKGAVVSGKDLKTGLEVRLGDKVPGYGGPEPFYTVVHFDPESDSVFTGDSEGYWSDYEFAHVAEEVKEWKEMQAKQSSADDDIELNFNNYSVTPAAPADALLAMGDVDDDLYEAQSRMSNADAKDTIINLFRRSNKDAWDEKGDGVKVQLDDGEYTFKVLTINLTEQHNISGNGYIDTFFDKNSRIPLDPDDPHCFAAIVVYPDNNLKHWDMYFVPAVMWKMGDPRFPVDRSNYRIKLNVNTYKDDFNEFKYSYLFTRILPKFLGKQYQVVHTDSKLSSQYKDQPNSKIEIIRKAAQVEIKKAVDQDRRIQYNTWNMHTMSGSEIASYGRAQIGLHSAGNYLIINVVSKNKIVVGAESMNPEIIEKIDRYAPALDVEFNYRNSESSATQTRGFVINVADAENLNDFDLDVIVNDLYDCYKVIKRAINR